MKRALIPCVALLLLASCKAKAAGSVAPAHSYRDDGDSVSEGYAGRDYADANYGGEIAMEETRNLPADEPDAERITSTSVGQRWKEKRAARQAARAELAAPAAPAEPLDARKVQPDGAATETTTAGVTGAPPQNGADGAQAEPEPAVAHDDEDIDGRHIVYTAAMRVAVFNLDEAMRKAEALPVRYDGYVSVMQPGHLVVRIPSKHLRTAMDELAEFGTVDDRRMQALDVTAEFVDIESRIRALTETQTQLLDLLSKARTVEEALKVRQALDQINTELEVLKGRMRQLSNQITYSTLTINMYERGPHDPTPSSNDPFPWVNNLGVESTEYR